MRKPTRSLKFVSTIETSGIAQGHCGRYDLKSALLADCSSRAGKWRKPVPDLLREEGELALSPWLPTLPSQSERRSLKSCARLVADPGDIHCVGEEWPVDFKHRPSSFSLGDLQDLPV